MAEGHEAALESVRTFADSPYVVALLRSDGTILAINRRLTERAVVGLPFTELVAHEDAAELHAAIQRVRDGGPPQTLDVAVPMPDSHPAFFQANLAPHRVAGDVVAITLLAADVTTRRQTEERLRRAEALLVDTEGTAHLGTWEWDVREPTATWSDELYRIYGVTRDEYTPSYENYLTKVHPDDRAHVMTATDRVFREHKPYSHDERILRPDGAIRYLHTWAHAILDERGQLTRLVGVCLDITDRKLAELALEERAAELARANEKLRAEIAERARVEQLLRRSQRLEAMGRLAGGIAHDFNNVLSVVSGFTTLMLRRAPSDSPSREPLQHIMSAVEQAARMTHQLLAFGREQVVERGPVDLERVVIDMTELLRRLISKDTELVLDLGANAAHVQGNQSQVEQVIVNLVVNARDAMPDGGCVTISTASIDVAPADASARDLEPGEYVRLTVRDTGVGMSEEVLAQIFDPFFTTKEEGKGTGLGLSTVYGILKQSGGSIAVSSRVGEGTKFSAYFPRERAERPQRSAGE